MLDIIKIRDSARFPIVDFKLQNRGRGVALLRQFSVSIRSYIIDPSPVIRSFLSIHDAGLGYPHQGDAVSGPLSINLRNDGWGPASSLRMTLTPPLSELFPQQASSGTYSIDSGATLNDAVVLTPEGLAEKPFQKYLQSKPEQTGGWLPWQTPTRPGALAIQTCDVRVSYADELSRTHQETLTASTDHLPGNCGGSLLLTEQGFVWEGSWAIFCLTMPSAIYYVSVKRDQIGTSRHYPISHRIPPGDIEHFSVMLGSDKSCTAEVQFQFLIDADTAIASEPFTVNLRNPMNERHHTRYINGDELITRQKLLQDERTGKVQGIRAGREDFETHRFSDSGFPFLKPGDPEFA